MKQRNRSPLYWREARFALNDMVRQLGFPCVFWALAPYERSHPYPEWARDAMAKTLSPRLFLPVAEATSMAHAMLQTVRGLLAGKQGSWAMHILAGALGDGPALKLTYFTRLEFQDGTRKRATHGAPRIRPPAHSRAPLA